MLDTLCDKLKLRVNDYPIILNEKMHEARLKQSGIKKAGFLQRLIIKPQKDEVVFWSKNCVLDYIEGDYKNTISPVLHKEVGTHLMFGTTAYLWYKENMLSKFVFQIIRNAYVARLTLEKLEKKLIKYIGQASSSDQISKIWKEGSQEFILEFPNTRQHGYIHLILND